MNHKEKIVIFDFCETLVNFQTADAFVDFIRINLNNSVIDRREKINKLIRSLNLLIPLNLIATLLHRTWSLSKRLKLWEVKGVDVSIVENLSKKYYETKIKPNLIPETLKLLLEHQGKGHTIWLISGGYGIYLKHFVEEYHVNHLISSNIEIKNGICTGKMDGLDCVNDNKIKLFWRKNEGGKKIEVINSYSDSITDIPILSIAEEPVVVSSCHQEWIEKYRYKEIIIK